MADGPRDHVVVGLEEDRLVAGRSGLGGRLRGLDDLFVRRLFSLLLAPFRLDVVELPPREGSFQRAREIAADGGLFCNDKGLRHPKHHSAPPNGRRAGILGRVRPSPFYSLVAGLSWPVLRLLYRLRAEGEENLPDEGGYVLAANHISNLDPWPLGVPLWPKHFLRFMAKSELYWWPLNHVINAGGGFPVRRGEHDLEAIKTAVDLAREGNVVAMFPHGTRQRKGLVKKYQPVPHTGAARIALEAGVPLVPAAIAGTDRLSRLGPLRVRYGKPVPLDDLKNQDPSLAAREATDRLMAEIDRLGAAL